jgi:hypothetical protein
MYRFEQIPFGPPRYPEGVVTTESHYQYGPDTYLLQHRDVDFPVRLRQYMKASCRWNIYLNKDADSVISVTL